MDERDQLIDQLIKEKGGSRKDYLQLLDSIAYHESAGTVDPTIKQIGGGPGRGVYQFEEGTNAGGITAARRTKQYYNKIGRKVPKWLDTATSTDSLDVTTLNREQQDALFLGNMRQHPKADFSKVWKGEETITDFWANYHWAGDAKDRKARVRSFDHSLQDVPERAPERPVVEQVPTLQPTPVDASLQGVPPTMEDFTKFAQKQMAMGGPIGQPGFADKEVNEFGAGGTHGQNPLGGIPQGIGANGQQNSVEEDETSYEFKEGKFIFSNRIRYEK